MRDRYACHHPVLLEIPSDAPWASLPLTVIDAVFREVAPTTPSSAEMYAALEARLG